MPPRKLVALALSLALHGALFAWAFVAPRPAEPPRLDLRPVEIVEVEPPPPPEPEPEPEPRPEPKPEPEPEPPPQAAPKPRPRPARRPQVPKAPKTPQDGPPPRFELPTDQVVRGGASGVTVAVGETRGGVPGGVPGGTGTPTKGPVRSGSGTAAQGPADAWAPASASRVAELPGVVSVPELACPAVRELGVFGTVRLRVQVRRDGRVRRVKVLSGIGHGCDAIARKALARARFRPAKDKQGRPVDFELTYEYVFELED